jgi:hypothetical protein
MRRFRCGACATEAPFDADRCEPCGAPLGYIPSLRDIRGLHELPDDAGGFTIEHDPTVLWRCLNHAWGCNWMLSSESGDVWCVSCRLTRGRPDTTNPDAVDAWSEAERVKRRLVDQLIALDLPFTATTSASTVVFDLLYLPDGAGATGHSQGVVTLDLREIDDVYRDFMRVQLGEQYREVIGHLRHEIGHHYWPMLVERPGAIDGFRALFGDERSDYATALSTHYDAVYGQPESRPDDFISSYGAAHPSEDWAEIFAHYLHLRDGLETAAEQGLCAAVDTADLDAMLAAWRPLTKALDELSLGLGHRRAYPFHISGRTAEKLAFVHRQLATVTAPAPPARP